MPGTQTIPRSARLLIFIVLGPILTSCGTFINTNPDISWGARIGLRPDDPVFDVAPKDSCDQFKKYMAYAVDLKEAYRSRATQNRTWIYVAGITGLGIAAVSGGLAAAGAAAAGTLGLLAISGGFTAGFFATIDNAELANVYTVAANDIGAALAYSQSRIARCSGSKEECSAELAYLTDRVTSARSTLETARTASAAGALARATAQKKLLDEEIAKVQAQIDAQAKTKDATEKRDAAIKAQVDADTKKRDAEAAQEKADKTPAGKARDAAQDQANVAKRAADDAQKNAAEADKAAKEADAKAKADAEARAAATAPVSPPCLTPNPKP